MVVPSAHGGFLFTGATARAGPGSGRGVWLDARVCCVRPAPGGGRSSRAEGAGRMRRPRAARPQVQRSAFAGFRFPPEVIMVAVRWYLRYGLSYRDVEELLAERGVEVDHVTVYRLG